MRFKNLTPFRCALRPTSTAPGTTSASVVLRGAFRLAPGVLEPLFDEHGLAQGNLCGETFDEDDDTRAGEARYPGDFADWKLGAEVMFVGSAHAPKAIASKEFPVKLGLGAWSKALVATGPRPWTRSVLGDVVGEAIPFTQQKLSWSIAFGGADVDENPAGCSALTGRAPMLEYPDARATRGRSACKPAGFGPISSNWPARVSLRGARYDAEYKKTRAPYYPVDFDGRYFHAAPKDQQLTGFLRGDEALQLVNLHPRHAILDATLPGLRPRIFLKGDALREVPLELDTVLVDGDAETVFLTWRGLTRAADPELRDLRLGLVATEPLAESALPLRHYEATFAAFEADPIGLEAARAHALGELDATTADLPDGVEPSGADVIRLPETPGLSKFSPPLAKKVAGAAAAASAALPKDGDAKKQVDAALAREPADPVLARKQRAAALSSVRGELEKARAAAVKSNATPEALAKLDAMLADPKLDEAEELAKRLAVPEPHELVPGARLAGRDLSHMDLAGMDLSAADLTGADLTEARLDGAKLVGAKLDQARLIKTSLVGAVLTGASATRSVWHEAKAIETSFEGVRLDGAIFSDVELARSTFRRAEATLLLVSRANAEGAVFDDAHFTRALFQSVVLRGATFGRARLRDCALHECDATRANFADAVLDGSSFNESTLHDADLRRARGARCSFFKADLERADLRSSALTDSHFSEASCKKTRLFAADLRSSRFRLANLTDADLRHANLFRADLGRANVTRANFADANLYAAQLLGLAGEGAHFVGSNLVAARMDPT